MDVRPVEARPWRPCSGPSSAYASDGQRPMGRRRTRDVRDFSASLDPSPSSTAPRRPVVDDVAVSVAEHVRMAAHELVVHATSDVGHREPALLLGDRGVELDLVQQVAELLDQRLVGGRVVGVEGLDRVDHLVGLLDQVRDAGTGGSARCPTGTARAACAASWWKRTDSAPTGAVNGGMYSDVRWSASTVRSSSAHVVWTTASSGVPRRCRMHHRFSSAACAIVDGRA